MAVKQPENKTENPRAENDEAWKHILNAHLKDFVEFFWLEAYEDIDWTKPYEILEQELLSIGIKEEIGNRYVDKLFKVFLKNGREQWLLLHIEVQHTKENDFTETMFIYFYRIYDRYRQDVASIAILADTDKTWRPNQYRRQVWNSEIARTFEVIKLIDFKSKIAELENHTNPFAMVILIQLAALETKVNDKHRLLTKLEFIRALHKRGWSAEKSLNMYRFLDTLLCLNPKFELEYAESAKKIDEEFNVSIMLTGERLGYQKGMQEGIEQGIEQGIQYGEAHMLLNQLKVKFNDLPESYVERINRADANTLNQWGINLLMAQSLDEVFKQ